MFQAIKNITELFRIGHRNCSPLCAHCEVEVSERTAMAISKLIEKRINQVSNNLAVVAELQHQKDLVLSGAWHDDYDNLCK